MTTTHNISRRSAKLRLALIALMAALASPANADSPQAIAASEGVVVNAASGPSSGLFMTFYQNGSMLNWSTCGTYGGSSGCFANGSIGPFGHACGIIAKNNQIYVADTDANNKTELYVYQEKLGNGFDSKITLTTTVGLPIRPDSLATCKMALTSATLFFGTNTSEPYAINLSTYAVNTASAFGAVPAVAITANNNFAVVSQASGFTVFDAEGNIQEDGGQFSTTFIPGESPYLFDGTEASKAN